MLTGNKGEWSEIYTLLKVLSDKVLFAGDENLNRIENLIFPVIKILRDESSGTFEFGYQDDIVVIKGGEEELRLPVATFKQQAVLLLSKLQESQTTTFSIPEIESFINSFHGQTLKAKSTVKSDIKIIIHDQRTGTNPELGFSIKSQLGRASTLLNAGKTTNFIYQIKGVKLTSNKIDEINAISGGSKIKDRIDQLQTQSGVFEFIGTESENFGSNLILIDSALPTIISEMLLTFFISKLSKTKDLVSDINSSNPLKYNTKSNHPFYAYKVKRFLTDIALGMMPSKVWTGKYDATGGYLVVKDDGEILCYHIYNRNEFEDYLLNNTKFETASSNRHGFGKLYTENGELMFKLNLQIRFLK